MDGLFTSDMGLWIPKFASDYRRSYSLIKNEYKKYDVKFSLGKQLWIHGRN